MEVKQSLKSVWTWLRISFYTMVGFYFLILISPVYEELTILDLTFTLALFSTFVLSIIHLVKYEKKGFAITSLVISSIFLFIFLIGVMIGISGVL